MDTAVSPSVWCDNNAITASRNSNEIQEAQERAIISCEI